MVFQLAHGLPQTLSAFTWQSWADCAFILGGLTYSIRTVYQAVQDVTEERLKAIGFLVLTEGVMVTRPDTEALPWIALGLLICINALTTACIVARKAPARAPKSSPQASKTTQPALPALAIEHAVKPRARMQRSPA